MTQYLSMRYTEHVENNAEKEINPFDYQTESTPRAKMKTTIEKHSTNPGFLVTHIQIGQLK
jgi:chitodextrinase